MREGPRIIRFVVAALALLLACAAPALADELKFPPLTGRVVDAAHVLPAATQADLTRKLAALQDKTGHQLIVVTLPTLQGREIEDYGYQLGRAWKIGHKDKNDGALLILAPNERKVRVEVGYGLEPVLTDALTRIILHDQVLPHLRQNDIPGGVEAGTDALVQQLGLDPAQARQRVQQAAVERPARRERGNPLLGILIAVVIFVVFILIARRSQRRRYGDGYDRGPGIWPFLFLGGMGGWGGGGGDSNNDSGGGGSNDDFGGGDGGSFGGGGSSDSY